MIIGKEGQQPFVITDPMVSRKHCKLTKIDTNTFEIEDLGSRNGTFVNGISIVKCKVTKADKIMLGPNFQLNIDKCIGFKDPPPQSPVFPDRLRHVYNGYNEIKNQLQTKAMMLKYIPYISSGIIALIRLFTSENDVVSLILTAVIALAVYGVSLIVSESMFKKNLEKKQENEDEFKSNYIDLGCKSFIGNYPPKYFEGKGCICPLCKKMLK
jgi:hypothetical protein